VNEVRQLEEGGSVNMVKLTKKKFPKSKGTGKSTKKTGIAAKAAESGMPASVLSAVYRRGIGAAKTTGTRPGVKSPQQWAMARVNSFIAKKPGTWGGADKDLAAKVRGSKKKKKT